MQEFKRKTDESYDDYRVRLFENKDTYKINCQQIADLLNFESGNNFNESTYRKFYAAFNEGRKYEQKKNFNGVCNRILSLSDFHVPFQLPIETFSEYVEKVDVLQINGDVLDCQSLSKFSKVYRISQMEEIIGGRQYLIDLIEFINPKEVVITFGNHDLRLQNYLSKNLDTDLLELMPQTALELIFVDGFNHYDKRSKSKIWYEPLNKVFSKVKVDYTSNWFCQIGETIFCHPLAFNSGILKTSERAMQWFRNEGYIFTSLVMAHTHRIGEYIIGNTTTYEQGCCCDVKSNSYIDGRLVNSQKEGFLYICQDKDGKIIKDKTKQIVLN